MNKIFNKININKGGIMTNKKQSIKCNVYECNFCNCAEEYCSLNEIKVSSYNDKKCTNKESTICDSFKKKKN